MTFPMVQARMGGEEIPEVIAGPGGERKAMIDRELIPKSAAAPQAEKGVTLFSDLQRNVAHQASVVLRVEPTEEPEVLIASAPPLTLVVLH